MRPLNISPSQAKDYYYESDPCFPVNGDSTYPQSQWHGEVSKTFEIHGQQIKQRDFVNIISGNDLKGKQIIFTGKDNEGNDHHRAAIDIPFSAPKSVSICALHMGDKKLIGAHQQAIKDTIKYIEENYIYVRYTTDKTRPGQTDNGLFATFMHSTSRSNDPQLHSHTLLMNMSLSPYVNDWRATWNDKIFEDQKHITMVYQNVLASNVKNLGYEIEKRPNGFWEIAGIKQAWIDQFSKRKKEIDEKEQEIKGRLNSDNDSVLRNVAVLDSRDDKDSQITENELKELWENQVSKTTIKESIDKSKNQNIQKETLSPEEYLRIAYTSINENESTFKRFNPIDTAISLSVGEYTSEKFEKAFIHMVESGEIVKLSQVENERGLIVETFTSNAILQAESDIIKQFGEGLFSSVSYLEPAIIKKYIESKYRYFTKDQKEALIEILSSHDQFIIIQGDAGTGKTTLLKSIKEINDKHHLNIKIRGLGYTGKSADELEKKSGIKSKTISSFLMKPDDEQCLYIVDESSMVGSFQMLELMNQAKKTGSKIVFIGDGKQLQAISAGKMFKVLTSDYMKSVMMEEAIRQKTDYMKDTVKFIKDYQNGNDHSGIDKAFEILKTNNRILEIKDRESRINTVIKDYLSEDDHINNLIVTPKNDDRKLINDRIIAQAQNNGRSKAMKLETEIRIPISVMGEKRLHAVSYKKDQHAFITSKNIQTCIRSGENVSILSVDNRSITFDYKGINHKVKIKDVNSYFNSFKKMDSDHVEELSNTSHVYLKTLNQEGVFKIDTVDIQNNTISLKRGDQQLNFDLNLKGRGFELFKHYEISDQTSQETINQSIFVSGQNISLSKKLSSGKEIIIKGTDEIYNTIDVEHGGSIYTLDLKTVGDMISVYETEIREFAEGDKIVFLKNDQRQELQNGLTAIIDDIDHQGNIRAKVDEDRYVYFKASKYQYFDHGYAVTVHKSQGQDTDKVYIVSDSEYKGLNNTEGFYVGVSRGKQDAFLYVDNASMFKDQVKLAQNKTSTLDHIKLEKPKQKIDIGKGKQYE